MRWQLLKLGDANLSVHTIFLTSVYIRSFQNKNKKIINIWREYRLLPLLTMTFSTSSFGDNEEKNPEKFEYYYCLNIKLKMPSNTYFTSLTSVYRDVHRGLSSIPVTIHPQFTWTVSKILWAHSTVVEKQLNDQRWPEGVLKHQYCTLSYLLFYLMLVCLQIVEDIQIHHLWDQHCSRNQKLSLTSLTLK